MQGWKTQDWKTQDHRTGAENARPAVMERRSSKRQGIYCTMKNVQALLMYRLHANTVT